MLKIKLHDLALDENKFSKECIDLIDKLLEKDPDKRISAEEALSHKWFEKNKIKEKETDINPKIIEELINNLIIIATINLKNINNNNSLFTINL